jgi:probable O-glycosylation ligase (exosortase A-associated)
MAMNPGPAWIEWGTVWKIQLFVFITMMTVNTRERIHNLVLVTALSLGFYGLKGGIFTIVSGGGSRVWGPAGSFIGGNNEIGLALIMTIPLLRYLQLASPQLWFRYSMTAIMVFSIAAIMGTQSRGALVGAVAMVLFMIMKSRNKILLLIGAAILAVSLLSFMPKSWFDRMNTIKTYQSDASAMGRINAWHAATNISMHRLFGGGYKCLHLYETFKLYAPNPDDVHDAHSIYFEVLAEHGLIGLVLYLLIGFSSWKLASKTLKIIKPIQDLKWLEDLVKMLQVSMVGYASAGAFLGLAMFDLYYGIIALIVISHSYAVKFNTAQSTLDISAEQDFELAHGTVAPLANLISRANKPSRHNSRHKTGAKEVVSFIKPVNRDKT